MTHGNERVAEANQEWERLTTIEDRLADLESIRHLLEKQINELKAEKVDVEKSWNALVRGQWELDKNKETQ